MVKRYHIRLPGGERERLEQMVHAGKHAARVLVRVRILLKAHAGWSDARIVEALGTSPATVERIRKRYVTDGLDAVLRDKPQPGRPRRLSAPQAAHLIALACSDAPDGHDHWPLRLLGAKLVELGYVERISPEMVREVLKKNELEPWRHEEWCLPRVGGAFVATMEDVLEICAEPFDPARPVVCLDEKPVTLHRDTTPPFPVRPGHPARSDYEYVRGGTANLFVCIEPLRGYRHITTTDRRTKLDYAQVIKWLVDEAYPTAHTIRLVQDNLNTHLPGSLYDAFEPDEARRLLRKLEFHYTPVHGSWLNMAEIELAIIGRECLRRRVGDRATLEHRVTALEGLSAISSGGPSPGPSPPTMPGTSSVDSILSIKLKWTDH